MRFFAGFRFLGLTNIAKYHPLGFAIRAFVAGYAKFKISPSWVHRRFLQICEIGDFAIPSCEVAGFCEFTEYRFARPFTKSMSFEHRQHAQARDGKGDVCRIRSTRDAYYDVVCDVSTSRLSAANTRRAF